jgi:hypothetical protein
MNDALTSAPGVCESRCARRRRDNREGPSQRRAAD